MSRDRITASLATLGLIAGLVSASPMPGKALAASDTGGFAVRGLGSRNCRDLTAAHQGENAEAVVNMTATWIAGYVSHFNKSTPGIYEALPILDNAAVARLAINICQSNPDAMFEAVMAMVIASFRDAALFEESELMQIVQDGAATSLRRDVFRMVQQRLIDEGFLPAGTADGQYGPLSRQALIAFQSSRGIATSGIPDPATLVMLFVSAQRTGSGNAP